jgi:multidrug resistance efflux pump
MITALRDRVRPDNLHNQVRAGGKNLARRIYLYSVALVIGVIALEFIGPVIFLDADGLVMKERTVVGTDYSSRVTAVLIKPGDSVQAGQHLITIQSPDAVEKMAEIISKLATMTAREAQLKSRAGSLSTLKPVVSERRVRALESLKRLRTLLDRQLTTSSRLAEATREVFEAEREEAKLIAEEATLSDELRTAGASREELQNVLATMRLNYNDGKILAAASGTVGPKVVSPGSVLKPGEAALDIYRGRPYVVTYLPTSRIFSVEAGDMVVVTDGKKRAIGIVQRIETLAEAAPPEFQSAFRSVDRQQVARVEFDLEGPPFPIYAKVKVAGRISVTNVTSFFKSAIGNAADRVMRLAGYEIAEEPAVQFADRPADVDDIVTGSVPPKK